MAQSGPDPTRPFTDNDSAPGHHLHRVADPRRTWPDPKDQYLNRVAGTEIMFTIDAALLWSSDCISQLVGLAQWQRYVDGGGDPAIVAANMLQRCERIDTLVDELPRLVERIRAVAAAIIEKAGS